MSNFRGWNEVAKKLNKYSKVQSAIDANDNPRLNPGQCASLNAIAKRIKKNGLVIADEVGMGKTRIAVELSRCVVESGGRVIIVIPPGLGYQWQSELNEGRVEVVPTLRSLWAFLKVWESENLDEQEPWFEQNVILVTHTFTNWRLGENTEAWRWSLLPELYALWRKETTGSLPRNYVGNPNLTDEWVRNASKSIIKSIGTDTERKCIRHITKNFIWGRDSFSGEYFQRGENYRKLLEKSVGLGLGQFDLVIIDEAHKNRGDNSGLSRLLESVVLQSKNSRRVAMTATPVELDISQWQNTLARINVSEKNMVLINESIKKYSNSVDSLRISWRTNPKSRLEFQKSAQNFQEKLAPYLLRRDKREDEMVKLFHDRSKLHINEYRKEVEISVNTNELSIPWKRAICSAESLSLVTKLSDNPIAKRLRLTLGNGHGLSAIIDHVKRYKDDKLQDELDGINVDENDILKFNSTGEKKRHHRTQWWLESLNKTLSESEETLFQHPAILAAVESIEEATSEGEKVLVFGRFTKPMRALVYLLNAREMLRVLSNGGYWPQSKVHGYKNGKFGESEWTSVRAAHKQIKSSIELNTLDEQLKKQYMQYHKELEKTRKNIIDNIEMGLLENNKPKIRAIFEAIKLSVKKNNISKPNERDPLILIHRAIVSYYGENINLENEDISVAFTQIIDAFCEQDDGDINGDGQVDSSEAAVLWEQIKIGLNEEFNRPEGSFARLMYGNTKPATRRMIQLAFNRQNCSPKVLVAQSLVGREGLNLHKACRIVVLLHPEWNPGVVEQQIGRIDRVGSHWGSLLRDASENISIDELPRIEIRAVIFKNTYDEYNWTVLRERWDDLRAQLHGVVIQSKFADGDEEYRRIIEQIEKDAPKFSPLF